MSFDFIRLNGGRYRLRRDRDGAGDSGMMLNAICAETGKRVGENGEIAVGCAVQCGTPFGRTMSDQDWWLTMPITEIIERSDEDKCIKFRTQNSTYTLTAF